MDPDEFYRRVCRLNFGKWGDTALYVMKNMLTIHESQMPLYTTPFPFQKNRVEFSPELVDASVQSIKDHLEYLGYYNSSVEPVITEKDKWKKVVYYITPGTRYKIKEIRFKLPQGTSLEADFLDDVDNISVKVGDYLSEADLEVESARSVAYLRTKGYYSVNTNYYSSQISDVISSVIIYLCGFVLFIKLTMNRMIRRSEEKKGVKK